MLRWKWVYVYYVMNHLRWNTNRHIFQLAHKKIQIIVMENEEEELEHKEHENQALNLNISTATTNTTLNLVKDENQCSAAQSLLSTICK